MRSEVADVAAPVRLGEGPLWDARRSRLVWVDVLGAAVHEFDPATGHDVVTATLTPPVTAVALHRDGGYVVAAGLGIGTWDGTAAEPEWFATVPRGVRTNDGKADPAGRFLVGTMVGEEDAGGAALYRLERGDVRVALDGATISNGLDWSPDGATLYYVDTPLERIDAFDYDVATGALSGRRTFVDLRDIAGRPDGLTVDAEGGVWVAMARGGSAVLRYAPDGRADHVVRLPVPHATSVAFGGDGLADLYVTTSQLRMADVDLREWPLAGALFRVDSVGVEGREPHGYVAR